MYWIALDCTGVPNKVATECIQHLSYYWIMLKVFDFDAFKHFETAFQTQFHPKTK